MEPLRIVPLDKIPLAQDVPVDNLLPIFRTVVHMEQLCEFLGGVGLSAVQVGIPWKLFIVRRDVGYEYYLNCEYTGIGEKIKSIEGCLSLRDLQGDLRRFELDRYSIVRIIGKQLKVTNDSPNLVLQDVNQIENDIDAIVFQHEIDHFYQREKMIDTIGQEIVQ